MHLHFLPHVFTISSVKKNLNKYLPQTENHKKTPKPTNMLKMK